jgi:hypothetical protein
MVASETPALVAPLADFLYLWVGLRGFNRGFRFSGPDEQGVKGPAESGTKPFFIESTLKLSHKSK